MAWGAWIAKLLEDEHPYYHHSDADEGTEPLSHSPSQGTSETREMTPESFFDSLVIILLAALLAGLVYYRQARLHNERDISRAQEQGPGTRRAREQADEGAAAVEVGPISSGQQDGVHPDASRL